MKNTVLSIFLIVFALGATYGQERRPGGFGQGQERAPRNFGASAGIIKYDADEALKKLKIEEEDEVAIDVIVSIETYNIRLDSLQSANQPIFNDIQAKFRSLRQSGDFSQMRGMREEVRQKLSPIREEAKKIGEDLDSEMAVVLDEKQLKKWNSYKASKRPYQGQRRQRN